MLLYLVWSGLLGEEVVALQVPDCLHDRLQVLLSRAWNQIIYQTLSHKGIVL